jgi:hypothetical protein
LPANVVPSAPANLPYITQNQSSPAMPNVIVNQSFPGNSPPGSPGNPIVIEEKNTTGTPARKPWRFGEKFQALFQRNSADGTPKTEAPRIVETKTPQPIETYLPAQNKAIEKKLEQKVPTAFSTAMATQPPAQPPVVVRPETAPLAIPGPNAAPNTPAKVVLVPDQSVKPAPGLVPPPEPITPTPAAPVVSEPPKRPMWGTAPDKVVQLPGKSVVEAPAKVQQAKLPASPASPAASRKSQRARTRRRLRRPRRTRTEYYARRREWRCRPEHNLCWQRPAA